MRRARMVAAALTLATLAAAPSAGVAKDLDRSGPPLRYQRPDSPLLVTSAAGEVWVVGGDRQHGHYLEVEHLPVNGRRWKSAGTVPSRDQALLADATLLRDGRVLVIDFKGSSSLYDPVHNRWRSGPTLGVVRGKAALTALPDGTALASGGCCAEKSDDALSAAEIYDPKLDRWVPTRPMGWERVGHRLMTLPDGRAVAIDGATSVIQHPFLVHGAELFDPHCGCWKVIGKSLDKASAIVSILADGRVLVAGGRDHWQSPVTAAAILDPTNDSLAPVRPLPFECPFHTEARLADGRVLVVCIPNQGRAKVLAFRADGGTWEVLGNLRRDLLGATLVALPDGRALLVGGAASKGSAAGVEIIDPR